MGGALSGINLSPQHCVGVRPVAAYLPPRLAAHLQSSSLRRDLAAVWQLHLSSTASVVASSSELTHFTPPLQPETLNEAVAGHAAPMPASIAAQVGKDYFLSVFKPFGCLPE